MVDEKLFRIEHLVCTDTDEPYSVEFPYYSAVFCDLVCQPRELEDENRWYYYEVEVVRLPLGNQFVIGFIKRPELSPEIDDNEMMFKFEDKDYDLTPGQVPDSIGFSLKSGEVSSGGGLIYKFPMEKIIAASHRPHKMQQYVDDQKMRGQRKRPKPVKDQDLVDFETYDYIGDTVGIALHPKSGTLLLR